LIERHRVFGTSFGDDPLLEVLRIRMNLRVATPFRGMFGEFSEAFRSDGWECIVEVYLPISGEGYS
jgi:hypothetical protein